MNRTLRIMLLPLVLLATACAAAGEPADAESAADGADRDAAEPPASVALDAGSALPVDDPSAPDVGASPDASTRPPDAEPCVPEPESCNDADDDCDGLIDEAFDFDSDPTHCGGCGLLCAPANALSGCTGGACVLEDCVAGFHDIDGAADTGCEYPCDPNGDEVCNDADDDCDGLIDEVGGCACEPDPAGESCNRRDDDCDGAIDEDFDLSTDPNRCGACDRACSFDNGRARCDDAACVLDGCNPGWQDLDGPQNGCEYACNPAEAEVCNDADDDCDGDTDEGLDCGADCAAAPDPIDADGLDSNCDGVDGVLGTTLFVRPNGDDAADGQSPGTALATVERALTLATVDPTRDTILVAAGAYARDTPLRLLGGVSIHGGYAEDFSGRGVADARIVVATSPAFEALALQAVLVVDRLAFESAAPDQPGAAAIGGVVDDSSAHLSLVGVRITAGTGAAGLDGRPGEAGAAGTRGSNAEGDRGGAGAPGGGRGATGRRREGGPAGGNGAPLGPGCGGGGPGSGSSGLGCNDGDPRAGGAGQDGCLGTAGEDGAPADSAGELADLEWSPLVSGDGRAGTSGGGGGGGGAGGGEDCSPVGCNLGFCGTGRGGGGGGSGGSGGTGGLGGGGGGASIGLLIRDSTVALDAVRILTGGGGNGGQGGDGGFGGGGGPGGAGGIPGNSREGRGGVGGTGGAGGRGGCGGGGGGGPSVALRGLGDAGVVRGADVMLEPGAGGEGGASCGHTGADGSTAEFEGVEFR